jgi:hypothetical protein
MADNEHVQHYDPAGDRRGHGSITYGHFANGGLVEPPELTDAAADEPQPPHEAVSWSGDAELWSQAYCASQRMIQGFIRATLRQVMKQVLRHVLVVVEAKGEEAPGNDTETDMGSILLSQSDWEYVQDQCQAVAMVWADQLHAVGHVAIAQWLRERCLQRTLPEATLDDNRIVDKDEKDSFISWLLSHNEQNESGVHPETGGNITTKVGVAAHSGPKSRLSNAATKATPDDATLAPSALTNLGRLWKLGQTCSLGDEDFAATRRQALRILEDWSREGRTEWPYDMLGIEQAIQRIPSRLWVQQQCATAAQADEESGSAKRAVMHGRGIKRRAAETNAAVQREPEQFLSRPPSQESASQTWTLPDVTESLTGTERAHLEATYLHQESASPSALQCTILGPLTDLGRFHYWNQSCLDNGLTAAPATAAKRRRQQRKAAKERLGYHSFDDADTKNARVVRTSGSFTRSHWVELDLTDCWVEVHDPLKQHRWYYAFGSLEVILADEDA